MADEATLDPSIVITARGVDGDGVPFVVYRRTTTGATWTVRRVCNQCGLCVIGVANTEDFAWHGPPGTPYAVTDLRVADGRPDEPVVPGFIRAMREMARQTPTATVDGCALRIDEEPMTDEPSD